MDKIMIDLDGRKLYVTKEKYIAAKANDLKEFGYGTLTEKELSDQLEKVLNKEPLSVIGMFIEKDIVTE